MTALKGVRVLELGQLIAGPFAGFMLGGFGAEVIKVEPPEGGDPMRGWRMMHEGTSLWWYSIARNKKSITLDLRQKQAHTLLKRLIEKCDILIENFRPGRMEKWGLGYDELKKHNPGLIMVRVSGWGQDGPYASRPGFASVAESIGGLRHIVGDPDRPPVRTGISIGDSLAGLHAVIGALTALHHREKTGQGQVVDTAIYESVFNMMESTLPEFDFFGHVRERSGSKLAGIVPTNTYRCSDGKYVIIGGNGDSIFQRLMRAAGRADLAEDPRLARNPGRVEHEAEIDQAIEAWTSRHTYAEVHAALDLAEVPAGPIYSIADIASDPQYAARKMFEQVTLPGGRNLKIPSVVPKLSETPGETRWIGPELGAHNSEVYGGLLGLSEGELADLRASGVV
jgi:crotonobetainyl-CoA:carnitine CoA-transferase CaiB-like acyl-CoA transferase